jgi:hypothetical protein
MRDLYFLQKLDGKKLPVTARASYLDEKYGGRARQMGSPGHHF